MYLPACFADSLGHPDAATYARSPHISSDSLPNAAQCSARRPAHRCSHHKRQVVAAPTHGQTRLRGVEESDVFLRLVHFCPVLVLELFLGPACSRALRIRGAV